METENEPASLPVVAAPPRMSITAGEGGLGVMFAALAKAQANFQPIKADVTVEVKPRESPAYKFAYAPLENVLAACVPALNAEGFFFSQPLYSAADGEGYVLRTCLMHASGGMIEVQTYIPKPTGRIQDLGSAITYQRRYVAQALFGVNSEADDDAATASGDAQSVTKIPHQRQQPSAAPPQQRQAQNGAAAAAPKGDGDTALKSATPTSVRTAAGSSAAAQTGPTSTTAEKSPDPKGQPGSSAFSPAPAAAATPSPVPVDRAPANETRLVRDEPMSPELGKTLSSLFGQLLPRVGKPMATKIAFDVTGKTSDSMTTEDGLKLKAHLEERIAKQGQQGAAS